MTKKLFYKAVFICLLFVVATGCKRDQKFDRQKWAYGDGMDFPLRDEIVNDLVQNHHLKGLNYRQVIDSLGDPQQRDVLQVSYQVLDNTADFNRKKPAHIKSLILYFSKDSVVTRAEIEEHNNKK
jgi:hypothetical protein